MLTKVNIDTVTGLLLTKTVNILKISIPGTRPIYTSLRSFQNALQKNAMAVNAPNTTLGHLGLVLPDPGYISLNTSAWSDSILPSDTPAKATTSCTITNIFEAQEAICAWYQTKNTHHLQTHIQRTQSTDYLLSWRPVHQRTQSQHHWLYKRHSTPTPRIPVEELRKDLRKWSKCKQNDDEISLALANAHQRIIQTTTQ